MRYLAVIFFFCCAQSASADGIPDELVYPISELVESTADEEPGRYRVVLGALEKINRELVPEQYIQVRGRKTAETFYLPDSRRTSNVNEFYQERLGALGQILFSCEGRTCGSSNYWANRIMERAILYGPEQYQFYHVAKVNNAAEYLIVYIGQRATRKIYVHIERIEMSGADAAASTVEIISALETTGRFVVEGLSIAPGLFEAVSEAVQSISQPVVVVVHDNLARGESLNEAMLRTNGVAADLRDQLLTGGESTEIDARGMGPLGPSDVYSDARIEFLVLGR